MNSFTYLLSSSLYLFKLGLAPQIQDLYGKVDFTGKELIDLAENSQFMWKQPTQATVPILKTQGFNKTLATETKEV